MATLEVEAGAQSADEKAKLVDTIVAEQSKKFIARCEKEIKGSRVRCGLGAKTKEQFEACDEES